MKVLICVAFLILYCLSQEKENPQNSEALPELSKFEKEISDKYDRAFSKIGEIAQKIDSSATDPHSLKELRGILEKTYLVELNEVVDAITAENPKEEETVRDFVVPKLRAIFARANLYVMLEDFENALKDFGTVIEQEEHNRERSFFLAQRGRILFGLGKKKEGIRDVSEAISYNLKNAQYLYNRAVFFFDMKRFEDAIIDFSYAIEITHQPVLYYQRSNCYMHIGRFAEAIEDLKKGKEAEIKENPKYADLVDPSYHHRIALGLFYLQKFEEAIEELDIAIKAKPDFPEYFNQKGVNLHHLKRYDEAIEMYSKAIELLGDKDKTHIEENLEAALKLKVNLEKMEELEKQQQKKEEKIDLEIKEEVIKGHSDEL